MLGARTKQVYAYGKRGHRIVNISEDRERSKDIKPVEKRLEDVLYSSPLPRLAHSRKKIHPPRPVPSPEPAKKVAHDGRRGKKSPRVAKSGGVEVSMPVRHPLGQFSTNMPGSPAIAPAQRKKRKPAIGKGSPLAPLSPFVDVEIVIVDNQGRRVSQEKRTTKLDVQVNRVAPSPIKASTSGESLAVRKKSQGQPGIKQPTHATKIATKGKHKARPIVISSDESESDDEVVFPPAKLPSVDFSPEIEERPVRPPRSRATAFRRPNVIISPDTSPSIIEITPPRAPVPSRSKDPAPPPFPTPAPLFIPWTPQATHAKEAFGLFPSPIPLANKTRQLTPLRARPGRAAIFPRPPSPPSPTTPTDLDLSFDFSKLALSPSAREAVEGTGAHATPPPAYLQPLLTECTQKTPHEFSAFIEMFPFDPIVHGNDAVSGPAHFQKIGEASYSEVFGIGDVVLKVIPLRDEERSRGDKVLEDRLDWPAPSDAKDVLKEIIVTRAMGEMCTGFVRLLRTYIVRGKYPSLLLDLWDDYNAKKGSESARPDSFSVSQVYAIIVLPNGGPDLEAYMFESATKTGWRQACSLFWQVTRALAEAEDIVSFEHRDLHWGQILVRNSAPRAAPSRRSALKTPMDDEGHGVEATIIDLGLARMNTADKDLNETYWTHFDEEIFEGEGDYQFDVYRMMRVHNGDSWEEYKPLTNVMWLHYLAMKLLLAKKLRPPAASRKGTAALSTFTERECYQCLVEMEEVLGHRLAACKPPVARKGRRKTQAPQKVSAAEGPKSAADVLRLAVDRGWVR